MATVAQTPEFHFFVNTEHGQKLDPEDRKFIRRHVMKGKNLGRLRPLGSKQFREAQKQSSLQTPISPPNPEAPTAAGSAVSTDRELTVVGNESSENPLSAAIVPRPKFSQASTITHCLADTVSPTIFSAVLQLSSEAKERMFALEPCIHFEGRVEHWVAPLSTDAAYLNITVFAALLAESFEQPLESHVSGLAWHHHHKALTILRKRLQEPSDHLMLADSTIGTIMSFTALAFVMGDLRSARCHLEGIQKMVLLRGGWSSFDGNEKLITEILRCDLGMSLHSGDRPLFCHDATGRPWSCPDLSIFLDNASRPLTSAADSGILTRLNRTLVATINTMSTFCAVINRAYRSKQRITVRTFSDAMASTMYTLLALGDATLSPREDMIRLGLLSYAADVFLQWRVLGKLYPYLTSPYRLRLKDLPSEKHAGRAHETRHLNLWLLMTAAVSTLDDAEDRVWLLPRIRTSLSQCGVQSWREARELLMSIMWIGMLHDKKGEAIFMAT